MNLKLSKTSSAVLKPANATKSHINVSCNQTLNIKITGEVRHFYIVAKVRSIIVGQTDDTGGTLDHLQSYIPLTTQHKKTSFFCTYFLFSLLYKAVIAVILVTEL